MPKVVGVGTPIQLGEERKPCVLYAMKVSTLKHLRGKTGRTLPYAMEVSTLIHLRGKTWRTLPYAMEVSTLIHLRGKTGRTLPYAVGVSTLIHLRGKTGRTLPYAVGVESPMPFLVTAASFTDMPYVKGVTAPTLSGDFDKCMGVATPQRTGRYIY